MHEKKVNKNQYPSSFILREKTGEITLFDDYKKNNVEKNFPAIFKHGLQKKYEVSKPVKMFRNDLPCAMNIYHSRAIK